MDAPLVSVIVPAWNVEAYLDECLASAVQQSIGVECLEVIVVDDGSTDRTGAIADGWAARHPQVSVVHEPNSGGPGRPRNVGLDRARGQFVLFLDADDFLGVEAVERMTAMAARAGSDVVLGRMVGVNGRPVPQRAFARTIRRAKIREVYSSLSVLKLFRRDLIEHHQLRFEEGLAGGEDAPFTIRAYFAAAAISVIGDYDCYHVRLRASSQTTSGWKWTAERLVAHQDRMASRMDLLAQLCTDPELLDVLITRHLDDLLRAFKLQWVELDEQARAVSFANAARHLRTWMTPERLDRLTPWHALRAYCLLHGLQAELEDIAAIRTRHATMDPLVEGDRVYGRWPHFRDASGIPDRFFDVTDHMVPVVRVDRLECSHGVLQLDGIGYLKLLGGSNTLVLRNCRTGAEHQFPTTVVRTPDLRDKQTAFPVAGFTLSLPLRTALDGRALPPGPWRLALVVGKKGVFHTVEVRPGPGVRTTSHGELQLSGDGELQLVHGWRRLAAGIGRVRTGAAGPAA